MRPKEHLDKEIILERLRQIKPKLEPYGISQIGLFGSYVRGEQTDKSDVDILIDFSPGTANFFNYDEAYSILKRRMGRKIDLVTITGLNKYIGPVILKEVQYV